MDLTVVKVGGSLSRGGGLRGLCGRLGRLAQRHRLLVVPGGGAFADAVRELDVREGLGASTAHWMAILAMDLYGLALAGLVDDARTAVTAEQATGGHEGELRVLLPSSWLRRADPLPHSWDVTSDSIAAWVARECGAARLVLLKDASAMAVPLPSEREAAGSVVELHGLYGWEAVDGYLPRVLTTLRVPACAVDGAADGVLEELLEGGPCGGLSLPGRAP